MVQILPVDFIISKCQGFHRHTHRASAQWHADRYLTTGSQNKFQFVVSQILWWNTGRNHPLQVISTSMWSQNLELERDEQVSSQEPVWVNSRTSLPTGHQCPCLKLYLVGCTKQFCLISHKYTILAFDLLLFLGFTVICLIWYTLTFPFQGVW